MTNGWERLPLKEYSEDYYTGSLLLNLERFLMRSHAIGELL